ncbi:unnamed protein product [Ambrosiozyma monospora]|uniref:Unnamed protein product n=1 Tax=Ambrosiozyma monospora TaxID=43982 RepID=A0A9W6YT74_AMBMO|nr:unnamed protein product [Ambrosiozyma monospora]
MSDISSHISTMRHTKEFKMKDNYVYKAVVAEHDNEDPIPDSIMKKYYSYKIRKNISLTPIRNYSPEKNPNTDISLFEGKEAGEVVKRVGDLAAFNAMKFLTVYNKVDRYSLGTTTMGKWDLGAFILMDSRRRRRCLLRKSFPVLKISDEELMKHKFLVKLAGERHKKRTVIHKNQKHFHPNINVPLTEDKMEALLNKFFKKLEKRFESEMQKKNIENTNGNAEKRELTSQEKSAIFNDELNKHEDYGF